MRARPFALALVLATAVLAACTSIVGLSDLEKVEKPPVGEPRGVAVGGNHSCAVMSDTTLMCWGANDSGQLGVGDTLPHRTPVRVRDTTGKNFIKNVGFVSLGARHSCATVGTGDLYCWGANDYGQLGTGQQGKNELTPKKVPGIESVEKVQAGNEHTCAEVDKKAYCWGQNANFQVGNDKDSQVEPTPTLVAGLLGVEKVSVGGGDHTCAVGLNNNVQSAFCWGANDKGQCGADPATTPRVRKPTPVPIPGNAAISRVYIGVSHSCAILTAGGGIMCWGANDDGQLGVPKSLPSFAPQKVGGSVIGTTSLGVGRAHSCLFQEDQKAVACWGSNALGQLGKPGPSIETPQQIDLAVVSGSSKSNHGCGIANLKLYCWGSNSNGQIGDDTVENRPKPVLVRF